jgi:putative flippase GtrA
VADPSGGSRGRPSDYLATSVDPSAAELRAGMSRARMGAALRRRRNWEQLVKFCVVGATGYAVNLAVYTLLLRGFDVHYIPAAMCSFLVAVTNNYMWNRLWTFRAERGHVAYQGMRFLVVSTLALGANLLVLHLLVSADLDKVLAQAIAIVLVTPVNFVGNKLWSFGPRRQAP